MEKLMNSENSFRKKLEFGEEAERKICMYLQKQGYYTLPLYQFRRRIETENNGTPSFKYIVNFFKNKTKSDKEIASPDIIVVGNKKNFFCEVKRKQSWVRGYGVDDAIETGLDISRLEDYFKLMESSNMELHLYFIQEIQEPIGVYRIIINNKNVERIMENVRKPAQRVYKSHDYKKTEYMAFFNINDLEKINIDI